ncbi:MAG: hypothetical protein ACREOJ_19460, partial [Gemmatimonadaceae bacterium]
LEGECCHGSTAPVRPRRPARKPVHLGVVRPVADAPNDLWTADFKGQCSTGDGLYCFPLAIRTDTGVPFATQALHGLSYFNVW